MIHWDFNHISGTQVSQVSARTQQTAPPSLTRSGDVAPESWMNMGKSENKTIDIGIHIGIGIID